mmetsp:Transcript_56389/g.157133  ORF Transcript_56389/g.157133 Transcript_56389/m.157133 type:complete len:469 (-) Transcript_56389:393-1799(-)
MNKAEHHAARPCTLLDDAPCQQCSYVQSHCATRPERPPEGSLYNTCGDGLPTLRDSLATQVADEACGEDAGERRSDGLADDRKDHMHRLRRVRIIFVTGDREVARKVDEGELQASEEIPEVARRGSLVLRSADDVSVMLKEIQEGSVKVPRAHQRGAAPREGAGVRAHDTLEDLHARHVLLRHEEPTQAQQQDVLGGGSWTVSARSLEGRQRKRTKRGYVDGPNSRHHVAGARGEEAERELHAATQSDHEIAHDDDEDRSLAQAPGLALACLRILARKRARNGSQDRHESDCAGQGSTQLVSPGVCTPRVRNVGIKHLEDLAARHVLWVQRAWPYPTAVDVCFRPLPPNHDQKALAEHDDDDAPENDVDQKHQYGQKHACGAVVRPRPLAVEVEEDSPLGTPQCRIIVVDVWRVAIPLGQIHEDTEEDLKDDHRAKVCFQDASVRDGDLVHVPERVKVALDLEDADDA